jgi:hypothetical protein
MVEVLKGSGPEDNAMGEAALGLGLKRHVIGHAESGRVPEVT